MSVCQSFLAHLFKRTKFSTFAVMLYSAWDVQFGALADNSARVRYVPKFTAIAIFWHIHVFDDNCHNIHLTF